MAQSAPHCAPYSLWGGAVPRVAVRDWGPPTPSWARGEQPLGAVQGGVPLQAGGEAAVGPLQWEGGAPMCVPRHPGCVWRGRLAEWQPTRGVAGGHFEPKHQNDQPLTYLAVAYLWLELRRVVLSPTWGWCLLRLCLWQRESNCWCLWLQQCAQASHPLHSL